MQSEMNRSKKGPHYHGGLQTVDKFAESEFSLIYTALFGRSRINSAVEAFNSTYTAFDSTVDAFI
ncbi:hypothetical protein ACDX66_10330 [Peribacillus frigoritolerans]